MSKIQITNNYDVYNKKIIFEYEHEDNNIQITLQEAIKQNIDLSNAYFCQCDLSYMDLSELKFNRVQFKYCNLSCVKFERCDFDTCWFSCNEMYGVSFSKSTLKHVYFNKSDLHNTNFTNTQINNAAFNDSCLYFADFRNTNMSKIDFHRTNLTGIKSEKKYIQSLNTYIYGFNTYCVDDDIVYTYNFQGSINEFNNHLLNRGSVSEIDKMFVKSIKKIKNKHKKHNV